MRLLPSHHMFTHTYTQMLMHIQAHTHTHRRTHIHNFKTFYFVLGCGGLMGFSGDSMVKNPSANAGAARDMVSILGSGRSPGGRNGNPLLYFLPGLSHGQRRLVGYSP